MDFVRSMFLPGQAHMYKLRQEGFVYGMKGDAWFWNFSVFWASILPLLLYLSLKRSLTTLRLWPKSIISLYAIEYFFAAFMSILACTSLSGYCVEICIVSIVLSAPFIWYSGVPFDLERLNMGRRDYISLWRGHFMLGTMMAIISVDFRAFPRALAKSEVFGFSVMDTGVGTFMFAAGLASKHRHRGLTFQGRIKKSVISSLPLLLLGVGRFFLIFLVGYQRHISEYGVHWNFFFTLGFVSLFAGILNLPAKRAALGALVILLGYQLLLSLGLSNVVLSDGPRTNIVLQNKEGISCSIGYLGIFLIGVSLSELICITRRDKREWVLFLVYLSLATIGFAASAYILDFTVQPISRRLINIPYVLQITAHCLVRIVLFIAIEILVGSDVKLIMAVNRNQLFLFLFSNFLCGIVNVLVPTLFVSNISAVAIVGLYALIVSVLGIVLDKYDITLKFW